MTYRPQLALALLAVPLLACTPTGPSNKHRAESATQVQSNSPAKTEAKGEGEGSSPADHIRERLIAYEIDVQLVVDDVGSLDAELAEVAAHHGGYLSDVSLSVAGEEDGRGKWTMRVPSTAHDQVVERLHELGDVQTVRQQA